MQELRATVASEHPLLGGEAEGAPHEGATDEVTSIEVVVLWDTTVLRVDHLTPPRSYVVGAEGGAEARTPVILARRRRASLVLVPGASGTVEVPGTGRVTFDDLVASGRARPSVESPGAHELELVRGTRAEVTLPDSSLTLRISAEQAGRALPPAALVEPAHAFLGLSTLLHLGILASLAFLMPSLGPDDAEALDRDRILMMQHLLHASAERSEGAVSPAPGDGSEIGANGAAAGADKGEGGMGNPSSVELGHRRGIEGPLDNPDPHLARESALQQAAAFGMIGLLAADSGGSPNALTAPWGREDSLGEDPKSALGNMWGDAIGDAVGAGGMELSGIGEGGGGRGEGACLCGLGTIGHGLGRGVTGAGYGHGFVPGTHQARFRTGQGDGVMVNGRLPAEAVQRVIRQNFGRFRLCYEDGLRTNPSLRGRVSVKFVIDRSGGVSVASDGGSDLPDKNVVQCVVRGFQNLSFPEPTGGIVTVEYPLVLSPDP